MRDLAAFDPHAFLQTLIALATAFALGCAIGVERQYRQRSAGLRTNVLVAVGAAAFADLGGRVLGGEGEARIIAYVISGIGFLGAGVIMKEGAQVRGLNTAATLWVSAAVGAFAGAGFPAEAAAVTGFILACNTLLRPLVNYLNRRPIRSGETEALYRVHVICAPADIARARDLIDETLERHHYPIRDIETLSESEEQVELAASLTSTTADFAELDTVTNELAAQPEIEASTWSVTAET
jgi:putative Mg2+ transporter-C (MgtC) family protein